MTTAWPSSRRRVECVVGPGVGRDVGDEDRRRPLSPSAALAQVWVAAREGYRRVLENVTLADVVAGAMPPQVAELIELESAWRSFGVPAPD